MVRLVTASVSGILLVSAGIASLLTPVPARPLPQITDSAPSPRSVAQSFTPVVITDGKVRAAAWADREVGGVGYTAVDPDAAGRPMPLVRLVAVTGGATFSPRPLVTLAPSEAPNLNPFSPLGSTPWALMILGAGLIGLALRRRSDRALAL